MILRFATRNLQECAEDEQLAIRRWGPTVGKWYPRRILAIESTSSFSRLFALTPLRLHKLSGVDELYAVTLQGRWRVIMRKVNETEVIIEEVSNHYGD